MRRPHYLKRNQTSRLPLRLMWVDTEAVNEHGKPEAGRQRLTFGVALYEVYTDSEAKHPSHSDRLHFIRIGDFWDWCIGATLRGRTLWVLAHNWNYDAGILNTSNELLGRGWQLQKYINGKPPLIVRWERQGAYLHMIDTLNYFTSSLAYLGESIGLPKLTMPSAGASQEDWDTYAWRDVEIIREAFLSFRRFVREHDLGVMQPTLASQAFTAFRHRFMKANILVHAHESALDLEREAYHGGRTESYWWGPTTGKLYKLDINSMYPYIMRTMPLSVRFKAYFPSFSPSWWQLLDLGAGVVAECAIETDEPVYGLVRDHRLIFPVGRFRTVLSTPEVKYALENNHLKSVGAWAYYEREYVFPEFVDYFYALRQEYKAGDNYAYDYLCKILMNSLYGKFGQSGRKWVETDDYILLEPGESIYQDTPDSPVIRLRTRLGRTQMLLRESESENSVPILAAEITAYGRVMLWELIKRAGWENVYYVDTDSLVVNDTGYNRLCNLVENSQLGALKIEWEGTVAEFWTAKDYSLDGARTIKGIRKTARQIDATTYEQDMFRSWDYNLQKQVDGHIDVVSTVKHLTRINTKGVVTGMGRVQPIVLKDW